MDMAVERKPTTIRTLYDTVTSYIDDNKHSRDVNERWLCSILEPMLATFSGVLNNRVANKLPIAEFRAAEIEKEIASKRNEIERLQRDLAMTKV